MASLGRNKLNIVMTLIYSGNPLERPAKMLAFQKRWPVTRGKINIICKEWCMEMDQISQLKWDIPAISRGVPLYI